MMINNLQINLNKPNLTLDKEGTGTENHPEGIINVVVISRDNCSDCDELIKNIISLKKDSPEIKLEVLNIDSEEIKKADIPFIVHITPALLVNEKLKCYGNPSTDKLKKFLSN